ncbi:hypothetical protein AQUCO_00400726v1 [Aquilegia coerulea]|uniref:NB-ARC domain-containing protein n=1 Tax=Aquilegia coerulea TaxID=218851 RepID=A0A2G5EWC6_AQUCA|nr:hypothetical protein AQUCO_00400726v1 [Aquilegia coerulea]
MVYWLLSCFVSATLQVLLEKLADFGIKTAQSISDVDDKLQKLRRTLMRVQSSLHDAEEKQIIDMAWQVLLLDLEKVAFEADDLIDNITYKISKLESGTGGGLLHKHKYQVNKFFLSLYENTSAPNMTAIQVKLDCMLRELNQLCVRELVQQRHLEIIANKLQSTSLTDETQVFGREVDKTNIINTFVMHEESSRGNYVRIIVIIGIIGVGKTTLAQLIYNNNYQSAMAHPFDLKMWVSVTKDFDVMRVTRSIIEAATRENTSHLLNLESLQVRLTEILGGKKYLLVLDDLWNEKRNEWNLLLKPLKHGLMGSKIVVTTGSYVVSSLVGTVRPYHLKCLSDFACCSLLMEEALGDINLQTTPELEEIGMKIAKKCKGLPLAAKIVGSLLHSKVDQNEWNNILESRLWDSSVIKNELIPILRSGYHRLPSHVRQCFAYCSMFPQSYDFEKVKLVRMWMGEGFIIPDKERKMLEDIGSDYFDQLSQKSFFQVEGEKYVIHDVVHDLAQAVSGEKFLRVEETGNSLINTNTRHLSLVCEKIQAVASEAFSKCKGLRTFLLLGAYKTPVKNIPLALFAELESLRVLDLSGTKIEELAGNIGNLKHLRFLDLSNTLLKYLPETIQELCLLQTLRLRNCLKLLSLPKCTGRLKSLRHLELDGNYHLSSMPPGIGNLTGLQTVSEFIVGPERGQMKELKNMDNIRGSLCIKQLEELSNPEEALEANLANKKYLDRLELQWTYTVDERTDEHVLDKLITSPLKSLEVLTLSRYGGRMFPKWVSDPLFSKLTTICFDECKNCCLLPPLGQLPKLKSLKIVGMHELECFDEMFQLLEILELRDMLNLVLWVRQENDMPHLRELTIVDCPRMVTLPSLHYLRSLEKLELESCPQLPSLSEDRLSSSVQSLIIQDCNMVSERCKEVGGVDWMKIEHIPYIEIDDHIVRE